MRKMLLSLRQRESRLPVKVLQAHRLNHLETGSHHPAQHAEYLHLRYRTAVIGGETAAEAVRAERLGHAVRPNLDAAIVDHGQRHAIAIAALGALAERLRRTARPEDLNIHAHQLS